ncbi:MAG: PD-(D/E)XK nuclease family protein, partial [Desulfuromonadales bacterium]|nr:PD-(D/E)XK nuclease family protein [Desulfuromonadales bacterium]
LWVLGLHDGALPAPARPNPFLPVSLQIEAGLPHADAEREAQFAGQVTRRLVSAAPRVILSHPLREKDATLLPSPLICQLPEGEVVTLSPSQAPALLWHKSAPAMQEFTDLAGPPLRPGEIAAGGTALLRDQALCPFRAFARHRLGGAALEVPDVGIDLRQRGNLLHRALELFWGQTGDQAGLLALGTAARTTRVEGSIDQALQELFPGGERPLLALERQRLSLLIGEWLQLEEERPPFTVLESEGEHRGLYGGLEIVTRIDRLDRLGDGALAIIDYKTGLVEAADLVSERLLEPQLPVYGLGRGDELAAVVFARLRRGDCVFCGVSRQGGLLPGVKGVSDWTKAQQAGVSDWPALLARWQQQLAELGREFAAGEAAVAPIDPAKACRRCDLAPLCRVAESTAAPAAGEQA